MTTLTPTSAHAQPLPLASAALELLRDVTALASRISSLEASPARRK